MNINCECYTCEYNAEGKCENGDITITSSGACADSPDSEDGDTNYDSDEDEDDTIIIECNRSDCKSNENNFCVRDVIKQNEEDTIIFFKEKGSTNYQCNAYEKDDN